MRFLSAVALLLLLASVAGAKPPEDPSVSEARRHYQAGLAHFNLKEYREAITEFEAGYRLRPDPLFLYNIGQSYRLADDPEQALHFYKVYLVNLPNGPFHREVQARIHDLEAVIEAKKNAARPPDQTLAPVETPAAPPAPSPAPPAAATTAPAATPASASAAPDARAGRTLRIVGLSGAAVGVAALATAIAMSVLAKNASDQLTHGTPGSMYNVTLDRQGRAEQNAAIALYAVGGAALVAGAVAWGLGWRAERGARRFVIAPSLGPTWAGADALVRF
jgi:tetratricopeptide (TPR) repeat protein